MTSQPETIPSSHRRSRYAEFQPLSGRHLTDWLLVLLNLGLVVSTGLLWGANNRSAKIQERTLTELEAPFIVVKINDPGIRFANLLNIMYSDLKFSFANYGRTPAHILDFVERITPVKLEDRLPPPVDPIKERGAPMPYGVIAPPNDETQEFATASNFDFTVGSPGGLSTRITQRPYFRGYVRYADIFSNVYVLGFCFTFDTERSRWVLMGNKSHNYCSKEEGATPPPSWYQPIADPDAIRASVFKAMMGQTPRG